MTRGLRRLPLRRGEKQRRLSQRDPRGFALLATLWLSMMIATLSLNFALEARHDRLAVANFAESAQATAAARAGVATALSRLDRLTTGTAPVGVMPVTTADPWQYADTLIAERMELGAGSGYDVHVRDVAATLDVNLASQSDWQSFFIGLQIDFDAADRLAQAIIDWRDVGDDPGANGAERDAYISSGRLVLPTNRNFGSIDELRDVMGMTPAIFKMASPYLSIGGNSNRVNVNTAPAAVLHTIPQFGDDIVNLILSARASQVRIASMQQLTRLVGGVFSGANAALTARLTFTTDQVQITSLGYAPGGRTTAVSVMTVTRAQPVARIVWRGDE